MDVNDVKATKLAQERAPSSEQAKKQRSVSVLSSTSLPARINDSISIESTSTQSGDKLGSSRAGANRVIDVVNTISETASDLEALTKSLSGILQQASGEELPDRRRAALESEANQLVSKIKEIAQSTKHNKRVANTEEDQVRTEVEQRIGKSLDAILPDEAKNAFGIGTVGLSQKDSIINTLAQIEAAKKRIEQARTSVDQARNQIGNIINSLDVASQNNEASQVSLRDLDQAVKLASQTRREISSDPDEALGSVGDLGRDAKRLLEQ